MKQRTNRDPNEINEAGEVAWVQLYVRNVPVFCVLIDRSDVEVVRKYKWAVHDGYAKTWLLRERRWLPMASLIIGAQRGQIVDHISGDRTDNRRSNLRIADKSQNAFNMVGKRSTTSRFRGVTFDKQTSRWRVYLQVHGVKVRIGRFSDEMEAAHIYNQFAEQLYGDWARLNPV